MKPVVAGVALEYRDTFTFAKLDVNTQPQKTREYNIRGTPTYIVFRDGEIAGAFVGAMSSTKLVEQILGILELEGPE
ncbi:thioredoxin family protein [Candidatus Poribacteria bacterium]|nr:thioredoxin family protein [Candidatus Poribacteria bacterium]MYG07563.1 thioredoxin family protein [Candidatus Poribacteria bacterium]MYK21856.1 thioredoxin family protein [Candidatus Poribacteria bacterium]